MNITLKGEYQPFLSGIKELEKEVNVTLNDNGIPLTIEKNNDPETIIQYKDGQGSIYYEKEYQVYRSFGLFLEKAEAGHAFVWKESANFRSIGPMFDLSRNAVMRVDQFKSLFRKLALMGFNASMLYMEDTYEVKEYPYFGYMRGRYTEKELTELDDYANQLGIELIPCIQTLAHLEEFLKWDAMENIKDTRGVLLTENEATYEFLDKMIRAATKPFRSNRLHIGMDEAEELGRGIYLNKFGYKDRLNIMVEHLNRVTGITDKLELDVMMWSDMFIKLASESGDDQYDMSTEISGEMQEKIPDNVTLMYWDYFHTKKKDYQILINKHKKLGHTPAFAGGIWVWNTFATKYDLSLKTSEAALQASKEEGIQDVFVTLWGDDGNENNLYSAMLGLQLYAEHQYQKSIDQTEWYKRTRFCTGISVEQYLILSKLDVIPGVEKGNADQTNPSKFLLWQDVLLGLFDKHIEGLPISSHYEQLMQEIKSIRDPGAELDFIWNVPEKLAKVLAKKASVGVKLKAAYDQKDKETLKEISLELIPEIIQRVKDLRAAHKKQWLTINKPFGWEIIDIRYGGLVARLETAIERITDYLDGNIDAIEELEQERLPFNVNVEKSTGLGWSSYYYRMASPNVFFHVLPIY
ncbi:beta-N-acetylhexosaminidase [Gracilibacillus kekensis]|uniref:Glycosyl hydrolase family 20, catalytic domain n=1 Tax=Gracilibacillus kekensis TaxID=1027249 RepID=A0A1M7QT08_9BACI|nr:beta-N-acetylhexosaminidase [Gracilibacillus kekensis]SHN34759.1 Glycosyl hydrolase family 20, catalytic domain [Gracilibacillus kekensis]